MKKQKLNISKDLIIERIQNYLYSFYAKDLSFAREKEVYDSLCRFVMEIVGKTWVASKKIKEGYEVYILSFEYLPGGFFKNISAKLEIEDQIKAAINEIGFDYDHILEFDKDPALGIGDMGMGSSYLINALTNAKIKATAYALRYESGDFKQSIENGVQLAESDSWLKDGSNFEHQKSFTNIIDIYDKKDKVTTYDMPIVSDDGSFVNTLRLFKSDPISDVDLKDFTKGDLIKAYENYINSSSLTKFLYVDDSTYDGKILRLKQEYFFAAASMRDFVRRYILYYKDIRNINKQTNVVINDIHPSLALVEFIRILKSEYNFSINEAIAYTREIFYHLVFSITDDSLEKYPVDEIRKMNQDLFNTIVEIQAELVKEDNYLPLIEDSFVIFKNINKSLSKEYIFLSKTLYEDRKSNDNTRYINMGTDTFTYGKSANPKLYNLLRDNGINDINTDRDKLNSLINNKRFSADLEEIKFENKEKLIKKLEKEKDINPYSIFDMQLSIMHEGKRQILNALAIAYEFFYLRDNSNTYYIPKTYIFSGKANEGYYVAKEAIKLIMALKKLVELDKIIREKIKIIFVENLNVSLQKFLYPACDIYSNLTNPLLDNMNFDILNTSINMSNILSTRGGIVNNLEEENLFYLLADSFKNYKNMKENKSYRAYDLLNNDEIVSYTTRHLINESYQNFPYNFKALLDEILLYNDSFNILLNLSELIKLRKEISFDFLDREKWTGNEIKNLIWSSEFNIDDVLQRKKSFVNENRKNKI